MVRVPRTLCAKVFPISPVHPVGNGYPTLFKPEGNEVINCGRRETLQLGYTAAGTS